MLALRAAEAVADEVRAEIPVLEDVHVAFATHGLLPRCMGV